MLSNLYTLHNIITNSSQYLLNRLPYAEERINLYFKNSTVKEVLYYAAFIALSHGAHVAFKPLTGDPAAYIATIVVGGLMQGSPFCQHQQSLSINYPNFSMFVGGANAILGCKAFSFLSNNLSSSTLALFMDTIVSSVAMCKMEQFAEWCIDLFYKDSINNIQSTDCCKN